jgi:membrane fusion protein (multidrug efflux system)
MTSLGTEPRPPVAPRQQVDDDLGFDLPAAASLSKTRLALVAALAISALGAAFVVGYLPRRHARAALEEAAKTSDGALLRVEVISPKVGSSHHALALPATVQALQETVVYSRADGYVRRWLVDIGDVVENGQLLAELDTPELDQQLDQPRAQLAQAGAAIVQAQANRNYSKTTVERFQPLTRQGVTSQQDLDQRQAQAAVDEANVKVAEANVAAQEANIRRLGQLKGFAHVVAPFAGRVTARTVELGALVTAGNASPLFKIATTDPARVFVQIPQNVAPSVHANLVAKVAVREYPNRAFDGIVTRASGELEAGSRTMTTEIRVPNADSALLPGMYAEVSLDLPYPHSVFEVPATAVMNDAKGMRVALVGPGDVVQLVPIVVERDTGAAFEISSGLTASDRVVKLATTALFDGRQVVVGTGDSH